MNGQSLCLLTYTFMDGLAGFCSYNLGYIIKVFNEAYGCILRPVKSVNCFTSLSIGMGGGETVPLGYSNLLTNFLN